MGCALSLQNVSCAKQNLRQYLSERTNDDTLLLYEKDSKRFSARIDIASLQLHYKDGSRWQTLPLEVIACDSTCLYAHAGRRRPHRLLRCCVSKHYYYLRACFYEKTISVALLRSARRWHRRSSPCCCMCTACVYLEPTEERDIVADWSSQVYEEWA